MVNIEANKVVSFHYVVNEGGASDGGAVPVDSSRDRGEPLTVLIGHGAIVPGLEKALLGHAAGDRFTVSVPPAEAYGERSAERIQRVPKKYFRDAEHLRPGMLAALKDSNGQTHLVTVRKIGSSVIDADFNHPLAGKTLDFDIEIVDVREAAPEEIAHGHAHGPDAHGHDSHGHDGHGH